MIKYALICGSDCRFEGWFRSSADFEALSAGAAVECPHCGSTTIRRAPMAPAVLGGGRRAAVEEQAAPALPAAAPARMAMTPPDPARALLMAMRQLRRAVEAHAEHVGPAFAEEARRIHHGEAPERAIYGEATPEDSAALREDGVPVTQIPWAPLEDA